MAVAKVEADMSQITTYFQPIMDLENWRVSGVESLARMEEGESAYPLIQRAKREGWYESIEIPLVETAIREAALLPKDLLCTLNVSAHAIMSDEFFALLTSHKERNWGIELLEDSERIHNFEAFQQRINDLGYPLFIDDAGCGNSDELRIRYVKPSVVKLDRLVLLRAMHETSGRTRLESLIAETRANGSMMLAEGVETADQLQFALELGCEYAQGWYFSEAVSASKVAATIAELEQRLWIDAP